MKAFRLTSIILLCIILLTGVPYFGYILYQRFSKPSAQPLDAVPEKAAFVIRINNPVSLFEDVDRSNLIWKEIITWPGVEKVRLDILMLDSLSQTDRFVRKLVRDNPVYITLAPVGRGEFGLIYLGTAGNELTPDMVVEFLARHFQGKNTVIRTRYASTEIIRFQPDAAIEPLYLSVNKGVFLMSRQANLVKKAIDRLSLNYIPASGTGFRTVEATAGKRTDANIFVNIPYLSLSAWKLASEETKRDLVRLARFADWCGLDVIVRKDEVLLNGYTLYSDSSYYTLALYSPQSPEAVDAVNILPDNTTSFSIISLENLGWYIADAGMREHRLESPTEPGRLSIFNAQHGMRLERYFLPWARNQFCFATAGMSDRNEPSYPLEAIQHADPDSCITYLKSLATALGKKTDSVKVDDRTIYMADLNEPLNAMFGNFRSGLGANCYMVFEGFTVFAQSPMHLVQMVNHWKSGTTLGKERNYLDISENVSPQSNFYFYCRPGYELSFKPQLLNDNLANYFRNLSDSILKFDAMTLQIVNRKGMFYTSISFRYNPNLSNEGPLAWQCALDTTVAGTPQIVARNSHGDQALLVTDTLNTLYMIDSTGTILWKKKLYGRVLGTFHPVRILGSDSMHYLFNTENHLYLLRSDGTLADRFPMKFPLRATNGLTVTDYNNTHDYRVLVAFRDNRVYNFSLEGIMVQGWQLPSLSQEIARPVEYLVYNHKDHLVIEGSKGQFMITDRRGKVRIKPVKPFTMAPGSVFRINRSGKKGAFITTDTRGRIVLLGEDGKTGFINCGTFSPKHIFYYEDMTGNNIPDYIFFDNNTLSVYNRSLKQVYSHRFLHDVSAPHMVRTVNGKTYLGIFSPSTKEVFLFDGKGLVDTESSITGTTPFDLGNLENRRHVNLVIGNGKNVKCFRLTQF